MIKHPAKLLASNTSEVRTTSHGNAEIPSPIKGIPSGKQSLPLSSAGSDKSNESSARQESLELPVEIKEYGDWLSEESARRLEESASVDPAIDIGPRIVELDEDEYVTSSAANVAPISPMKERKASPIPIPHEKGGDGKTGGSQSLRDVFECERRERVATAMTMR